VIRAVPIGTSGFIAFAKELHQLGVLRYPELLSWLELHGAVIRGTEPPLDQGEGIDEEAFSALREELGR
jgi:hypothetical protein